MLPNLVIIGSPRCGTTSLFRWLGDHPEVTPSWQKETCYFVDEDSPLLRPESNYHAHALAGYRAHFPAADPDDTLFLEATPHYLYQKTALAVLGALKPQPHVICLLRRPSARVYSSFVYTRDRLARIDPRYGFARWRRLVESGATAELEAACPDATSLYVLRRDVAYSQYVDYLAGWGERFGRDRLHLVLLEELRRDPRGVVTQLASRVGIDPAFYGDYPLRAVNEGFRLRSRRLHRLARQVSARLPRHRLVRPVRRAYEAVQRRGKSLPTGEDRRVLAELDAHFRPYDERLAAAFDLDLSAWETDGGS